ncbi:MAG: methyltransferase domain-containing protein, partial [Anaeromyxobacteraceae bacterium]
MAHGHGHGRHGGKDHAHHGHGHGHGHGDGDGDGDGKDHSHGPYDRHRNPADFERYRARLEDPDREAWQKPDALVAALGLRPGDVACDVGAGTGYLALRLARAVGSGGAVYAIDVEPRMIEALSARVRETGIGNVHPILARPGRLALPPRRCQVILVVNTFHHFADGPGYLRRLAGRVAPGGRIVVVDFHRRELPVGPPPGHKLAREEVVAAARRAGLE